MVDKDNEAEVPGNESGDEADSERHPSDEAIAAAAKLSNAVVRDFGKRYNRLFSNTYSSTIRKLTAGLVFPKITDQLRSLTQANLIPQSKISPLIIDPVALNVGKSLADIVHRQRMSALAPFLEVVPQQRKQWDSVFESLRRLAELYFPPNWAGVKRPDFEAIEVILIDEGIPLAWVPGPKVLQSLFDAPDAAVRRQVIGRRWRRIVSECETVLGEVDHPDLQAHRPFALEIVQTLQGGHASAAQALAANLIDSVLRRNFDKDEFKDVTTNKKGGNRFDLDAYRSRVAFTLAPIWRAYGEYWQGQGDPIPRNFGRHPSAHAVSRTQYSRVNAVIALMLVTSLLKLLDGELDRL